MLTIIGCGNSNRTDDGVGVFVAQRLKANLAASPRPNVSVFDAGTGGIDVMFQARGSSRLIIIDASSTGSEPGTIFEVPADELVAERQPGYSLHDFRWDHAIHAGRQIFKDDFPADVTVYLIEAASLGLGLELTDQVRASAEKVIERVGSIIAEYE
ncbi:MAG: hydrogenase maturation protease [Acidobacteria bacterium]|nr:hydrogenase maturation protease [Acidobacteriota bacterium]